MESQFQTINDLAHILSIYLAELDSIRTQISHYHEKLNPIAIDSLVYLKQLQQELSDNRLTTDKIHSSIRKVKAEINPVVTRLSNVNTMS